jgi:hypothetical protein
MLPMFAMPTNQFMALDRHIPMKMKKPSEGVYLTPTSEEPIDAL